MLNYTQPDTVSNSIDIEIYGSLNSISFNGTVDAINIDVQEAEQPIFITIP